MSAATKGRRKPVARTAEQMVEQAQIEARDKVRALVTDWMIREYHGVRPHLDALILARHINPHTHDQAVEAHRLLSGAIIADMKGLGITGSSLVQVHEALYEFLGTHGLDFKDGEWVEAIPEREEAQ